MRYPPLAIDRAVPTFPDLHLTRRTADFTCLGNVFALFTVEYAIITPEDTRQVLHQARLFIVRLPAEKFAVTTLRPTLPVP